MLAQVLAVVNAYIFHKYITFKSEAKGKAIIDEFFRFSTTYVVMFCLSMVMFPALVEVGPHPSQNSRGTHYPNMHGYQLSGTLEVFI